MSSNSDQLQIQTLRDPKTPKAIQEVKVQIQQYKSELVKLNKDSIEFHRTLTTVTTLQKTYNEVNKEFKEQVKEQIPRLTHFSNGIAETGETLNHTITGLKAAKDVMNAFGLEVSWMNDLIAGVQTMLAMTQVWTSFSKVVDTGKIAVRAFNQALNANPLVRIVTMVLALVAALAALAAAFSGWISGVNQAKKKQEEYIESMQELEKEHEKEIDALQKKGATETEIAEKRAELHKDQLDKSKERLAQVEEEIKNTKTGWWSFLNGSKKKLKELQKIQEELQAEEKKREQQLIESENKAAAAIQKEKLEIAELTKLTIKENEARKGSNWKYTKEGKKAYEQYYAQLMEAYDKDSKEYKEANIQRLSYLREFNEQQAAETAAANAIEQAEIDKNNAIQEQLEEQHKAALQAIEDDAAERKREALEEAERKRKEALSEEERLKEIEKEIEANKKLQEELKAIQTQEGISLEKKIEAAEKLREIINQQIELGKEKNEIEEQQRKKELEDKENIKKLEEEIKQIKKPDGEEEEAEEKAKERDKDKIERLEKESARLLKLAEDTKLSYEERQKYLEQYYEVEAELTNTEEDLEKKKQKAKEATLKVTQDVLSSAMKLVGEETVAGKAMAVAAATMSTFQSATDAYKSMAGIPIIGPGLGVAAAAAAVASGISNVKEILKTKVPGANDTTSASTPSVSLPSMPELQTPIQETHNNLDAYDEDFFNQTTRVYVVESDITDSQKRVKVAETESAF